MTPKITIRSLTDRDISAVMRLKELAANWNQTEDDWKRLIKLDPEGCFAACIDNHVIATTTTTSYGKDLAWIGMVLVHPAYRRRGIGTRMLMRALDYLKGKGVRTIKLDSVPDGQGLYEKLGFIGETVIERWGGVARPIARDNAVQSDSAHSEMLLFDQRAFGTDRSELLISLMDDACFPPLISTSLDGSLNGYALPRHGTLAYYLGPVIAIDEKTSFDLVDGMLEFLKEEKVFLDLSAASVSSREKLIQRGFSKQRELMRMYYGKASPVGLSELVFAIAGPEVG